MHHMWARFLVLRVSATEKHHLRAILCSIVQHTGQSKHSLLWCVCWVNVSALGSKQLITALKGFNKSHLSKMSVTEHMNEPQGHGAVNQLLVFFHCKAKDKLNSLLIVYKMREKSLRLITSKIHTKYILLFSKYILYTVFPVTY